MGDEARRGRDYWLVRWPYALNFGWISAATILNASHWLVVAVGYDGAPLGPVAWSLVLVVVAASFAIAMIVVRRNAPFALATAWALLAIAAYGREVAPLAITALVAADALVTISIAAFLVKRFRQRSGNVSAPARYGSGRVPTPSAGVRRLHAAGSLSSRSREA